MIFRPKNPTASAGFEPANLGTKSQHATPRPPKLQHDLMAFQNIIFKTKISGMLLSFLHRNLMNNNLRKIPEFKIPIHSLAC